jgi:hypothetical protein
MTTDPTQGQATTHPDGVVIHVHTVSTPTGDRLTVYSGPDAAHLVLSGIIWCGRAASTRIASLLDPYGHTTEQSSTIPPPPPDVTGTGEPS